MSFWEDASPVVKGAIVFGVIGLLYFGIALIADLPPFGGGAEDATTDQRGLQPPGAGGDSAME